MNFTYLNKLQDEDSLRESWENTNLSSQWKLINSKAIPDSDGFMTQYAWYSNGDKHIFMFGDMDIYGPDEDYADWVCDSESEAQEWFDSYVGFEGSDNDPEDDPLRFLDEDFTYLKESYDNLPDWITVYLDRNRWLKDKLAKRNINLKTAVFEEVLPGNVTKSMLDDITKFWFLDLRLPNWNGTTRPYTYIPREENTDDTLYIGNRSRKISNLAHSKLIEMINRCGYIDLTDSSNMSTAIRNSRRSSVPQRDRNKGLHPVKRNIQYGQKPDGRTDYDNVLSYDIEWVTNKGYDKNGYPLNPDKYIKILNDVGCENCSARLDRMYNQLETLRTRLINITSNLTIQDSFKYQTRSFHNNLFNDIGDAIRDFSSIIYSYTEFRKRVDKLLTREPRPSNIDERIKNMFEWDAPSITKDIKELFNKVKSLENPIPLNIPEED